MRETSDLFLRRGIGVLILSRIKEDGGLLDPNNGYEKWISFLNKDDKFKKLVIPTIQFDTN